MTSGPAPAAASGQTSSARLEANIYGNSTAFRRQRASLEAAGGDGLLQTRSFNSQWEGGGPGVQKDLVDEERATHVPCAVGGLRDCWPLSSGAAAQACLSWR